MSSTSTRTGSIVINEWIWFKIDLFVLGRYSEKVSVSRSVCLLLAFDDCVSKELIQYHSPGSQIHRSRNQVCPVNMALIRFDICRENDERSFQRYLFRQRLSTYFLFLLHPLHYLENRTPFNLQDFLL